MITLEEACQIYEEKGSFWPIRCIRENESEWAFFSATDGFYDVTIPVINKETGELSMELFFKYNELPKVPIPTRYVKDPPAQTCSGGVAAFFDGPLVYSDGTPVQW